MTPAEIDAQRFIEAAKDLATDIVADVRHDGLWTEVQAIEKVGWIIARALAEAVAQEREACAALCEEDAEQFTRTGYPVQCRVRERAAAIRARAERRSEGIKVVEFHHRAVPMTPENEECRP